MKRAIISLVLGAIIPLAPFHSLGAEDSRTGILVEGVAASRPAAAVAALREIGERVNGLRFSIFDGKYIQLEADATAVPLDTRDKKTVEIRKLKSGLFKAVLKIVTSGAFLETAKDLRIQTVWGEGELKPGGSVLAARSLSREDALKKAILMAMAEQFPGNSAPHLLAGRVLFLGTVEEKVQSGQYLLVARIKVFLSKPQ